MSQVLLPLGYQPPPQSYIHTHTYRHTFYYVPYIKWMKTMSSFLTEISIITVIVTNNVVSNGSQFTVLYFPPLRCEKDERNYYINILPYNILITISVFMLAITTWVIHKVCWMVKQGGV